jgi:hypothetical protein
MRFITALLLFVIFTTSCKKEVKPEFDAVNQDTIVDQNKRNINNIGYVLTPEAVVYYKDWTQYTQFDTFITRYFAISNTEALLNAKALSKMANELKDSVKLEILKGASFEARLNILDSECKRLADMSTISSIKPDEVSQQIRNILDAYSSVNAKLNAVLQIQKMESELQLDPDFVAVLNQAPKTDSVPLIKSDNITKNNPQPLNNLQKKSKFIDKNGIERLKKLKKNKKLPIQPN